METQRAEYVRSYDLQRVEHAQSWEQQRQFYQEIYSQQATANAQAVAKFSEALDENTRSQNRLIGLVMAHDRRTGGSTSSLMNEASEMTGEKFTPSPDRRESHVETQH